MPDTSRDLPVLLSTWIGRRDHIILTGDRQKFLSSLDEHAKLLDTVLPELSQAEIEGLCELTGQLLARRRMAAQAFNRHA